MWLYVLLSPQRAIARAAERLAALQAQLASHDGEFAELGRLVRRSLGLALGRLGLTLAPALGASIPLIFQLVWLSNEYGYLQPAPGEPVQVTAVGDLEDPATLGWRPPDAVQAGGAAASWSVRWPQEGSTVGLYRDNRLLVELPRPHPVPTVHRRYWWNHLIGNPAGYLPDEGGVEALELALPARRIIAAGPAWAATWPLTFFTTLVLVSIAIKLRFRVH